MGAGAEPEWAVSRSSRLSRKAASVLLNSLSAAHPRRGSRLRGSRLRGSRVAASFLAAEPRRGSGLRSRLIGSRVAVIATSALFAAEPRRGSRLSGSRVSNIVTSVMLKTTADGALLQSSLWLLVAASGL